MAVTDALPGFSPEFLDLTVQGGILDYEAGLIQTPQEAVARSYAARTGFPELVVTCGPSGSGKSGWIAEHLPGHTVVSLDALRGAMAGKRADQSLNGQVLQAAKEALRVVLRRGGKVVWDATNTRRDFRRVPLGLGFDYGALTTLAVFQPPVSTLLRRNSERLHSVPPTVLAQQIDKAEFPYSYHLALIPTYPQKAPDRCLEQNGTYRACSLPSPPDGIPCYSRWSVSSSTQHNLVSPEAHRSVWLDEYHRVTGRAGFTAAE